MVGTHGEGGVSPTSDGRLAVRVTMADGQRVTRMVPARMVRTDPKAARRLAEQYRRELVEARDLELDPTRQTLTAYLRSWIESRRDAKQRRLRARTLEGYAMIVEQHIIPALGDLPLTKLTRRRIQAWVNGMDGAPQTVENRYAVLRKALNAATGDLIARNPAAGVELPEPGDYQPRPLTFDEARQLLSATVDDRLGALWRLALVTGLRQGELLGLGWDDLDGPRLAVQAQLQRLGRSWVRGATKAARSLDVLTLDTDTVALLDAHRRRQAAERQPEWRYWGLMFLRPNGEPFHRKDALRAFHEACDAAGIRRRRFHDLRHSADTLMDELGVPENVRMARLGHSTKEMARRYTQVRETQDRAAVERLAGALG